MALVAGRSAQAQAAPVPAGPAPSRRDLLLWIALPAVASALLLSFTHELCVDVASVPFLWVLPLSLYLLSFIITFSGRKALPRFLWLPAAAVALGVTAVVMAWHFDIALHGVVIAYSLCLLVLCIVLHGETFRIRPGPGRLTQFYLCVSLGGVLGGLFVAVIAPLVFPAPFEMPLALAACALVLAICLWTDAQSPMHRGGWLATWGLIAAATAALCVGLVWTQVARFEHSVLLSRNFYGTYIVLEPPTEGEESWSRTLRSGTTMHGSQFMEPEFRHWPTTYYARNGGVGLVMDTLPDEPRRVGVVGLGVGTLAAYGRKGDHYVFYEINPRCAEIARALRTYAHSSGGTLEPLDLNVVIRDALLLTENL